jgi:hypothetical protein
VGARKPYVLLPECRILPSGPDIANLHHVELQERGPPPLLFDPRAPMGGHGVLTCPTSSRHISPGSSTEYAELLDGDALSGALPDNTDEGPLDHYPSPFNSPLTSISSSPSLSPMASSSELDDCTIHASLLDREDSESPSIMIPTIIIRKSTRKRKIKQRDSPQSELKHARRKVTHEADQERVAVRWPKRLVGKESLYRKVSRLP